jgi:hypothetical protein
MTLRPILLAAAMALAPSAFADEAADASRQASLQGFAATHPTCVEWSDGCAVCRRAMSVSCSTPGIACQPRDITCKAP